MISFFLVRLNFSTSAVLPTFCILPFLVYCFDYIFFVCRCYLWFALGHANLLRSRFFWPWPSRVGGGGGGGGGGGRQSACLLAFVIYHFYPQPLYPLGRYNNRHKPRN